MDNLESRIRALEASNRRQRYSITALAAVIVGGTLVVAMRPAGNATFDTVTCKGWAVVDKDGKMRISATTTANGEAGMEWSDTYGKKRMGASTLADGAAGMTWLDTNGKKRMVAGTDPDGEAGMMWYDKDGKNRMDASTGASSAGMMWRDRNEKVRFVAFTTNDGDAMLPTLDLKR